MAGPGAEELAESYSEDVAGSQKTLGLLKMKLKEIVAEWLKEHGYDGLYCETSCGCKIDDLMPCDEPGTDCQPGYIVPCPGPERCEADGDCEYHIGKIRQ